MMTANLDGETNLKPLFASKYEVSSLLLHIFLVQPFTLAEVSSIHNLFFNPLVIPRVRFPESFTMIGLDLAEVLLI